MNETPAATPRVHAGCGHLCLTCGAQAAVRAVTSDVVINVCIIVSLAVATLLASVLISHVIDLAVQEYTARQKPVPPPMAGQSLSYGDGRAVDLSSHMGTWQRITTTLDSDGGILTTYTLVADEMGVARMDVSPGDTCMCSRGFYCAVSSGRVTVVGAEPGSVIHVGCW